MTVDDDAPLFRLNTRIGKTYTACFFNSRAVFEKAHEYAYQLGIGPVADKELKTMPQDCFIADADEFRKGALSTILADRQLRLAHSDALDSLFGERIIEVRSALRAQGWAGDAYDILTKDGARAMFKFDHAPHGRNVVGMSVNDIEDNLDKPAADLAAEVTNGAQEHLKRNRRVDVVIVAMDGSEGSYSVAFGPADQPVETAIQWKPEQPDAATQEVRLRMRRYVRFDGDPYVLSGDTWRDLEDRGDTDMLWRNLLSGVPAEQAVQTALGITEKSQPTVDGELEEAKRVAAEHGLSHIRVASEDDNLLSIGPVVAMTSAYIVQNVGMNNSVLHHATSFDKLPVLGTRLDIRYEAGKAVVDKGRTQSPSNMR